MNAEQIIERTVAEEMAGHQPNYRAHGCACGFHIVGEGGRGAKMSWMEFAHAHIDHVSKVIAERLTSGALKGAAAA